MEFAVHRGCGEEFPNACAHLVDPWLVVGSRYFRVEVNTPDDSLEAVVAACEELLCPWGGGHFRVSQLALICVRVVGMAQMKGAAPLAGHRCFTHWDRQSMASPRW